MLSKRPKIPRTPRTFVAKSARYCNFALLAILGACLAVWVVQAVLSASYPLPLQLGEGQSGAMCAIFAWGRNPYPSLDAYPWIRTPYAPLYIVASGLLMRWTNALFVVPRMISEASFLGILILVALVAKARSGTFAALCCTGFVGVCGLCFQWSTSVRPDCLCLLLEMSSLTVLSWRDRERGALLAGMLAGLATLAKQTGVEVIVAGTLFLACSDRRALCAYLAAATGMALAGYGLCLVVWGRPFWDQVYTFNAALPFSKILLLYLLGHYWPSVALLAIMAAAIPHRRPLLWWLYLGLAVVACGGAGQLGAFYNRFLPLQLALGICGGIALAELFARSGRGGKVLCTVAALTQIAVGALWPLPPITPSPAQLARANFCPLLAGKPPMWWTKGWGLREALIYALEQHPGPILADNSGDVVACHRLPAMTDDSTMFYLRDVGKWDDSGLIRMIGQRRFSVITLDTEDAYLRVPRDVLQIILENYQARAEVDGIDRIYLPRTHEGGKE